MESMPQFPENLHYLHAGVLKLFENMTSSQVQESPAPFFPMPGAQLAPASREALPKASLQLEHLVCNPSGRRSPIGPELQRGQCIGVLLKMKRLPTGSHCCALGSLAAPRDLVLHMSSYIFGEAGFSSGIYECYMNTGGLFVCRGGLFVCLFFPECFSKSEVRETIKNLVHSQVPANPQQHHRVFAT